VFVFATKLIKILSTPKSIQQLLEEVNVSERTLRYNLSRLKERKLIRELPSFHDMRRKKFVSVI
jgi:DNA-binding MarR family transcriptional regulator